MKYDQTYIDFVEGSHGLTMTYSEYLDALYSKEGKIKLQEQSRKLFELEEYKHKEVLNEVSTT